MTKTNKARHHRKPTKTLTKKQLSRHRRERNQLRWIWAIVASLAALVVIVIAIGLVSQNTRAMAIVNGQTIRVSDYQKRLRFMYHYLGADFFDSSDAEQRTELYQWVSSQLIDEALVDQEAQKAQLTVSDQEVQTEIEEGWFQHYRTPLTPTPSPTPDPEASPTEEGTPLPTPTPDTEEAFQTRYREFVQNVIEPAGLDEAYFQQMVRAALLKDRLQALLVPDVPSEEEKVHFQYAMAEDQESARAKIADFQAGTVEQVWARHILVETEEEAKAAITRIQGGEDFASVASELSIDESNKEQGGDLGWFGRGQMVAEFEEAAFGADLGLLPSPVQTQFGAHIIEILGHEDRPVDLAEEMTDAGWYNTDQLTEQLGPLFTEMVLSAPVGLMLDPVPSEFGVFIVEVLEHEVRSLSETDQETRRTELFQQRLDDIREEADIQDLWEESMVPGTM